MIFRKSRRNRTDHHVKGQVRIKDQSGESISPEKEVFINEIKKRLNNSSDLKHKEVESKITLFFIDTLVDKTMLHQDIIRHVYHLESEPIELMNMMTVGEVKKDTVYEDTIISILSGAVVIHVEGYAYVISAQIKSNTSRSLTKAENESQVIGPQLAFNENLSTNISLIRSYLANPNLCNEIFHIGKQTRTAISLMYIKDIASDEMVQTLRQRIKSIKIDGLIDSSVLVQLIDDNSLSIFPQMLLTERPDKASTMLLNGKLVVIVDGSSLVIGCPQSFMEFFQSMEDQNVKWHISSFLRLLRIIAMMLSVFFTAFYVASLTFHYEVIPQPLLVPLSESRSRVPFPPIIEALLLEFIIELLREAGARLPTKVGQTMGIVGGIVIGTAAVQAGFTSNILIIIIALGALASFTTPSYTMGNVIRILRFPIILLAGFWGFYGIMFAFCFLLIHLLRQSSLGSPYMTPFYPPRLADWKDSIVRLPMKFTFKRPFQTRPKDVQKYVPKDHQDDE
ncbi:spore germination protein [Rossellomorea sp. BNER]|uniref:spore germination protein n=1 Tax=Rossellomorea sp. BNER TaxID=2962031 RepID=UPI003AF1E970|nr:spore germination protein [Rossellomorea sp. BNER]